MGITRRHFLVAGGAIGGGLVVGALALDGDLRKAASKVAGKDGEYFLHTWIRLREDGEIVVLVPHVEMGQGVLTSLPMMLADEMDADWSRVRVEQAPPDRVFANSALAHGFLLGDREFPGQVLDVVDFALLTTAQRMNLQITGGSMSVRMTGHFGMRRAGAAAREMLLAAGAKRMGVPARECTTADSFVVHEASGQKLAYGDLAAEAAKRRLPKKPALKTPDQYTIMGTSKPRIDVPSKTDGSAVYGIDAQPPGLRFAAVALTPFLGGSVAQFDASKALASTGVSDVVEVDGGIAVVADTYWRAKKALRLLEVEYDEGEHATVNTDDIYAYQASALEQGPHEIDVEESDGAAALESGQVIEASYRVPYLAHATMEPMNCTAWVKEDGTCEVWAGVQDLLGARAEAADAAGLELEQVTVHPSMLGGGFGRRGPATGDYVRQGVQIASQVDGPVKMIWSREDDIRHDAYRPAITSNFKAVLGTDGELLGWTNDYVGKNEPSEAAHIPYAVPHQQIRFVEDQTPVPFGAWRSVAHSQHGFFSESFIDELAYAAGSDPYDFRRALLSDKPRHLAVLDSAAKHAGWGSELPAGHGRGIALQESFGSIVAEVAEVSVDDDGAVKVHRVVCAADTGQVVHPDSLTAQLESGIIFALSAALFGEIEIEKGRVKQRNFPDYPMVTMADAPKIETLLVPSGDGWGGAGEVGTPPLAPAVANAVFAATGVRVRELPLEKAALAKQDRG